MRSPVVLMAAVLALGAGCAPPPPVKNTVVEPHVVRIFQGKVEIADALKRMAAAYDLEHPGVHLEIETVGGGQDYDAALADRFQAGDLPEVFMSLGYGNLDLWIDHAADLTDEPWVGDLRPGTVDPVTRKGRIYGNPLAIEGYGFLYNKALFRRAGITDPPDSLPTLAAACEKLQAAGILPFSNGYAEYWVLGIHNFNLLLGSVKDLPRFIAALETNQSPGADAPVVEGWMDLLDLTARHGAPDATVTGDYTTSVAAFLAGKAAMIQQGNWIEPDLVKGVPAMEIGVLPMPVRATGDDRVPMGVPNFWVVNKDSPLKDEAKAWLEWLHSSPTGKSFLIKEMKVIPPYLSLESEVLGPLSAPFARIWKEGKTLPWVFPRYLEKTKPVAAALQAYLEHHQTHAQLWESLGRAWTGR